MITINIIDCWFIIYITIEYSYVNFILTYYTPPHPQNTMNSTLQRMKYLKTFYET